MHARHLASLFLTREDDEPLRLEKSISRLRIALALTCLIAITMDASQPTRGAPLAYAIVVAYAIGSVALLLAIPRSARLARAFAVGTHTLDILAGATLTLFTDGPNSPFFVFLTFPLLTAAYRWSTTETLLSAAASLLALGVESILIESALPFSSNVMSGGYSLNGLVVRASYLVIAGVAIGYLADREKQQRRESSAVAGLIREARVEAGLAGTLHGLLGAIGRTFEASRALLVVEERGADPPRTFLLDARIDGRTGHDAVTSSELRPTDRQDYLFPAQGHSWLAVDLSPLEGAAMTAVDERGELVAEARLTVPLGFDVRHRWRSLLGVTLSVDAEWTGRLLLINPQVGLDREEMVRFAQRLVRDIAPSVRQTSVLQRLRRRAERIERLRLARELHDGPIQTLSAAVLQLELMHRHVAQGGDEQLAGEVMAVQSLLRDEVANIRDMTQEMRLGLLDTDSPHLVRELADMVERFGRQHGIVAHFVSDEDFVRVSTLVRHELLRAVHEALINVRKHSGAGEALVWLRVFADRLILSVEDDGRGFAFDGRRTHQQLDAGAIGPVVIRERVAALGGELAVESRPGRGARLEFRLPLSAVHAQVLPRS